MPVEKHGVNGELRQKGKISELACGYGGSVGALKNMGAVEMGVQENELQGLINDWRNAYCTFLVRSRQCGNESNKRKNNRSVRKTCVCV